MSDAEFSRQGKCVVKDKGNELTANKGSLSFHSAHTYWVLQHRLHTLWDCAHPVHCFLPALRTAHYTKRKQIFAECLKCLEQDKKHVHLRCVLRKFLLSFLKWTTRTMLREQASQDTAKLQKQNATHVLGSYGITIMYLAWLEINKFFRIETSI